MKWLTKVLDALSLANFQLSVIVISLTAIIFVGWALYHLIFPG